MSLRGEWDCTSATVRSILGPASHPETNALKSFDVVRPVINGAKGSHDYISGGKIYGEIWCEIATIGVSGKCPGPFVVDELHPCAPPSYTSGSRCWVLLFLAVDKDRPAWGMDFPGTSDTSCQSREQRVTFQWLRAAFRPTGRGPIFGQPRGDEAESPVLPSPVRCPDAATGGSLLYLRMPASMHVEAACVCVCARVRLHSCERHTGCASALTAGTLASWTISTSRARSPLARSGCGYNFVRAAVVRSRV